MARSSGPRSMSNGIRARSRARRKRLRLALLGRQMPQIHDFDGELIRRLNDLHRRPSISFESRTPGFMPADDFSETALQRRHIQRDRGDRP